MIGLLLSLLLAPPRSAAKDIGEKLLTEKAPYIVQLTSPTDFGSGGTGFPIEAPSGSAYVLTNRHVCALAKNNVLAAHYNGRSIMLPLFERDTVADLCLLGALPSFKPFKLAPKWNEKAPIYAIGHPLLAPNTLTNGYVVAREMDKVDDIVEDSYSTSLTIYPGFSGSPVFNKGGDVVGVVFAADTRTHYGLIVPIDKVREFLSIY